MTQVFRDFLAPDERRRRWVLIVWHVRTLIARVCTPSEEQGHGSEPLRDCPEDRSGAKMPLADGKCSATGCFSSCGPRADDTSTPCDGSPVGLSSRLPLSKILSPSKRLADLSSCFCANAAVAVPKTQAPANAIALPSFMSRPHLYVARRKSPRVSFPSGSIEDRVTEMAPQNGCAETSA